MLEKIAYGILLVIAGAYLIVMVAGLIAFLPWGLIGLAVILAFGLLLIKVLRDHLTNPEDRYYSDNIDK